MAGEGSPFLLVKSFFGDMLLPLLLIWLPVGGAMAENILTIQNKLYRCMHASIISIISIPLTCNLLLLYFSLCQVDNYYVAYDYYYGIVGIFLFSPFPTDRFTLFFYTVYTTYSSTTLYFGLFTLKSPTIKNALLTNYLQIISNSCQK